MTWSEEFPSYEVWHCPSCGRGGVVASDHAATCRGRPRSGVWIPSAEFESMRRFLAGHGVHVRWFPPPGVIPDTPPEA